MEQIDPKKHPELQEGEAFYCNIPDKKLFDEMNLKTKRLGQVAYSELGRKINPLTEGGGPFPVFAQKSELEERGLA